MKPRTYLGWALLFPFIFWGVCVLIVLLFSSKEIPERWNAVLMPFFYYAFGIIVWLIPYSLTAIGIWVWSRNKTVRSLMRISFAAPLIFFVLMVIEVALVTSPQVLMLEALVTTLPHQMAWIGVFSLFFGYLFVGIAFGLFKLLQARNLIAEESTPQ